MAFNISDDAMRRALLAALAPKAQDEAVTAVRRASTIDPATAKVIAEAGKAFPQMRKGVASINVSPKALAIAERLDAVDAKNRRDLENAVRPTLSLLTLMETMVKAGQIDGANRGPRTDDERERLRSLLKAVAPATLEPASAVGPSSSDTDMPPADGAAEDALSSLDSEDVAAFRVALAGLWNYAAALEAPQRGALISLIAWVMLLLDPNSDVAKAISGVGIAVSGAPTSRRED